MNAAENDYEPPQKAVEALAGVLIEPYSDEDVESHASAWEATYGTLLLRPWETEAQFRERELTHKPNVQPLTLSMDPSMARADLKMLRDRIVDDPQASGEGIRIRINELERFLQEPETDWTKVRSRKQIIETAKARYAQYQRQPDFSKRVTMIEKEKDATTLHLLFKHDRSDQAREAAFRRIAEIEVTGG